MCRIAKGIKIYPVVKSLLKTTGIVLANGGGNPELNRLQENVLEYKIVVYDGLRCDSILFECQVEPLNALICFLMKSTKTIT